MTKKRETLDSMVASAWSSISTAKMGLELLGAGDRATPINDHLISALDDLRRVNALLGNSGAEGEQLI